MSVSANRPPLREAMRVNSWGSIEGARRDAAISPNEVFLVRKATSAISDRLSLGGLRVAAMSDASASVFVIENANDTLVLVGAPEADKLGDRMSDTNPFLDKTHGGTR
jgi:hypothetical protein